MDDNALDPYVCSRGVPDFGDNAVDNVSLTNYGVNSSHNGDNVIEIINNSQNGNCNDNDNGSNVDNTSGADSGVKSRTRIMTISGARKARKTNRRTRGRSGRNGGNMWFFRGRRILLIFWSFGDLIGAYARGEGMDYSLVAQRRGRRGNRR